MVNLNNSTVKTLVGLGAVALGLRFVGKQMKAESFGVEKSVCRCGKGISNPKCKSCDSPICSDCDWQYANKCIECFGSRFNAENDPDFDREKADRNKDGEISDWEQAVGNAVAKGIREHRKGKSEPSSNDDMEHHMNMRWKEFTSKDKRDMELMDMHYGHFNKVTKRHFKKGYEYGWKLAREKTPNGQPLYMVARAKDIITKSLRKDGFLVESGAYAGFEDSWRAYEGELKAESFDAEGGEPIYVVKRDYTGAETDYLIGTESYILKEMGVAIDVTANELDIDYEDMSLEEIFDSVFGYGDEYDPELIGKFTDGMYLRLKSYDGDKDVGVLQMFDGESIDYTFDLSELGFKHESNAETFGAESFDAEGGTLWTLFDRKTKDYLGEYDSYEDAYKAWELRVVDEYPARVSESDWIVIEQDFNYR